VVRLLDAGAPVDWQEREGSATALIASAANGHREVAALLLARGADVNMVDHQGVGALFAAIMSHHRSTVKLLLDSGADPCGTSGRARLTYLELALRTNDSCMSDLLKPYVRMCGPARDHVSATQSR
jgi:ankyrin repeat protein